MNVPYIIQLSYGIPGILSYVLVFWAFFGLRKTLNNSYILISILMAVFNIFAWINGWILLKLYSVQFFFFYFEWLSERPFLINAQNFLVSHFNYVQNVYLLMLTFDRFAAIYKIIREFKWWTNYYHIIIVIIQIIILGTHLVIRLPMANRIYLNETTRAVIFAKEDSDAFRTTLDANCRLVFGISTFLACSILNVLSLKTLGRMKKSKTRTIQRSFLFISMCIFLTQACNVCISCLLALFNTWKFTAGLTFCYTILPYFSDAFGIGPAIYTILMPGLVRKFLVLKLKNAFGPTSSNTQPSSSLRTKHYSK